MLAVHIASMIAVNGWQVCRTGEKPGLRPQGGHRKTQTDSKKTPDAHLDHNTESDTFVNKCLQKQSACQSV